MENWISKRLVPMSVEIAIADVVLIRMGVLDRPLPFAALHGVCVFLVGMSFVGISLLIRWLYGKRKR